MPKSGAVVADISAETDAERGRRSSKRPLLGFDAFGTQPGAQEEKMRQPGIEPGAHAWEAYMLPLHYWRSTEYS